jgi:methylenetetrahydrofolate dehydrogenase (NADP+) / methenyltetrahydrofolate cyclohydrolase
MILSGKAIADEIQDQIRHTIAALPSPPGLAVILIGDNSASHAYVTMKRQACLSVGIHSFFHHLPTTTSEIELLKLLNELNQHPNVDGILIQLPLPPHINSEKVISALDPQKDVDGFHPVNMGLLLLGHEGGFIPCTPLGIKTLLERAQIAIDGKEVVIVGRSSIVGKPLASLLMQNAPGCNATVTVVHTRTHHLKEHTQRADVLVAAIGSPRFIQEDMVKEGAVVIDVGTNREEDPQMPKGYRIVGDVDFNRVEKKCLAITPVPKGVGPMTVAMLLHNTLLSYQRRHD